MNSLVRIALIDRSPWAELFPHDEEHVERLAEDIRERGIRTPLHVYPRGERFELLAGHDRLEAAKRAGLSEVPVERFSTLTSEDERFEHFLKDNTLRKNVDRRAILRAVYERHPKVSTREAAGLAGCSPDTAHRVKQELIAAGLVSDSDTIVGQDGVAQPAHKPPRPTPAAAWKPEQVQPIQDRKIAGHIEPHARERSEHAPDPIKAMRAMREAQAPVSAAFPEPEPERPVPAGAPRIDVRAEMRAVSQAVERSAWNRLSDYAVALPLPPAVTDAEIHEAVSDADFDIEFVRQIRTVHAFLGRVLSHIDREGRRAAAG